MAINPILGLKIETENNNQLKPKIDRLKEKNIIKAKGSIRNMPKLPE